MWDWGPGAVVIGAALLLQWLWVPRLSTPSLGPDDPVPDFGLLARAPCIVLVALFALIGVSSMPDDTPRLWPWLGYVAIGAPLSVVDLRTTYLPNQLMWPLWAAVGAGLIVATPELGMGTLVGALVGGAVAYALFWCVWRWSSSLGFGDVRLAAAVGAVAATGGPVVWATSFVAGTALGAVAAIIGAAAGRRQIPYGPWLWLGPCLAGWITPGW